MKLFRFFYLLFLTGIFIYFIIVIQKNDNNQTISPVLSQNMFYEKLNHALSLTKINTNNFQYRDFINEVEFTADNQVHVILSTKSNPYFQINTLQQVLKKAKIDNKTPRLVNLAAVNPYATF